MKAHMPNSDYSLTVPDYMELIYALNLFISSNIDGVTEEKKQENNKLALSVINKLKRRESQFSAEDLRILYASLELHKIKLNESDEEYDNSEVATVIERLLFVFKSAFYRHGIKIDEI